MVFRYLLLLVLFTQLLPSNSLAQTGWKWSYGSGVDTVDDLLSVAADATRNMYTAGSCSFGINPKQYLHVKKTDSTGKVKWAIIADSCKQSDALDVVHDKDGHIYILGEYAGNRWSAQDDTLYNTDSRLMYFLVKCEDTNGTILWAKNITNSYNFVADNPYQGKIGVDSNGNVYVAGGFIGKTTAFATTTLTNADTSGITSDIFVAKYTPSGGLVWAKGIGGEKEERARHYDPISFTVTKSGNSYLSLAYLSPSVTLGATTITNPGPVGTRYCFLAKMDGGGNFIRAKPMSKSIGISAIATDAIENIYATGNINSDVTWDGISLNAGRYISGSGPVNAYVAMLTPAGIAKWVNHDTLCYGGGFCIAPDACGNIWFGGQLGIYVGDSMSFGGDTINSAPGCWGASFFARVDTTGTYDTGFSLPGGCKTAGGVLPMAIAVSKGSLYVGGNYYNTYIPMGTDTLRNMGSSGNMLFTGRYLYNPTLCPEDVEIIKVKTEVSYITPGALQLFPNPASNRLTITGTALTHVAVYNMLGQQLLSEYHSGETGTTVDILNLAPGMYVLRVNETIVKRFVKE